MKREDITQDTIDAYLKGELSDDENTVFEELLQQDEILQQDVRFTRSVINGFNKDGEKKAVEEMKALSPKAFKAVLNQAEKKYHKQEAEETVVNIHKSRKQFKRLVISVASVAAVALILIYIGFQPKYSAADLYKEYYSALKYEDVPTRGGDNLTQEQNRYIDEAVTFYQKGEYDKALIEFEKAISGMKNSDIPSDILFYTSVCLIETGQEEKAVNGLKYLSSTDNMYSDDAGWYLAMSYLKVNRKRDAITILSNIVKNKEHLHSQKAKELLEKSQEKNCF